MGETTSQKKIPENSYSEIIERLLNNMKYGNITLIIQDGKIIQIEKTEKYRFKD